MSGSWRRSPGYATTVALVVALVVLANAIAFPAVWGVLYKDLPYREAQSLVELRIDLRDIDFQVGLSPSMHAQLQQAGDVFSGVIGSAEAWQPRLDDGGLPWRIQRVTADFSRVLGVDPVLGRPLTATAGHDLLLSERAWRQRFGADPGVVGQQVRIGNTRYVVSGVMPPGFAWPDSQADAWTPFVASAIEREQELAGGFGTFHVAARRAPGVTLAQARARLETVLRHSGSAFLRDNATVVHPDVRPWRARFTVGTAQPLLLLQLAALLLSLVAAANLANLTIERVSARHGEFAVRRALGARWRDQVRVVLTGLLPPAAAGTLVGLASALSMGGLVQALGLVPDRLVAADGAGLPLLGAGLLGATLLVLSATAAGVLAATPDAASPRPRPARRRVLRAAMLVSQVAVATALCGSAGLLVRSALALQGEQRGFDATGVLLTQVDLAAASLSPTGAANSAALLQRLRERIRQQPGVAGVALADMPPFGGAEFKTAISTAITAQPVEVRVASVEGGYFEAMGIPLLAGSVFDDTPGTGNAEPATGRHAGVLPVIVDELFRAHWLPAGTGVGASVRLGEGDSATVAQVVGIVPAVKQRQLSEAAQPMLYLPLGSAPGTVFLVTRTHADPAALAALVQRELQRIAPGALLMFNQPLADAIRNSTSQARSLTALAVLLAAATGLLCALGCFALVAAASGRRRAEVGLRMALGATTQQVQRLIVRDGALPVVSGVGTGLLAGVLIAASIADHLHRTPHDDPATWLGAALLVAGLALFACWLPARKAARVPARLALQDGLRQL